ncbi:MAG: RNA polymerase factor sigma-54 [Planctomycetes bacterium]|nr:RNA polymerase factor sigma-54 [Planctomycetota bacterium]
MAMRMGLNLEQRPELRQILSPQMYLSMEILLLNTMDLRERIETELQENPTLEPADPIPDDEMGEGSSREERAESEPDERFEELGELEDLAARSEEDYGIFRPRAAGPADEERLDLIAEVASPPVTLTEYLESQLDFLSLEPRARALVNHIIGNLDERGYLMHALPDMLESAAKELEPPPPPLEELEAALAVLQGLDPPGVGGRDLKECLLLQLRRDGQEYPLERRIIEEHLDDLARNRLPKIAKALGTTIDEIKTATENIASLNPRPGSLFGGKPPAYVKPDVVVEFVEGRYEVRVESDYFPRLYIRPEYKEMLRGRKTDAQTRRFVRKKIEGAEWLINAIRQRQATVQNIAREIVDIQQDFLDRGIKFLKPLKMQDVADRVGVHVATISRAISGKYMQTPRGIFEMKFFFTGGVSKDDGTTESRGSVIQRIRELVDGEDKRKPLSDIEIVRELGKKGIEISRRTVTKYREAENIPSSRERRAY